MVQSTSWYNPQIQFQREQLDMEEKLRTRQLDLQERQMRLQNDPYRTFLNALATAGPQAGFQTLGSVIVDAAKFKLFGGEEALETQQAEQKSLAASRAADTRWKRFQEATQGDAASRAQFDAIYGMADVPMVDSEFKPPSTPTREEVRSLLSQMPNRREEQNAFFKGLEAQKGTPAREQYVREWWQQKQQEGKVNVPMVGEPAAQQPGYTPGKRLELASATPQPVLSPSGGEILGAPPTYQQEAEAVVRQKLGYGPNQPLFAAHSEQVSALAANMQKEGRKASEAVIKRVTKNLEELRKKQIGTPDAEFKVERDEVIRNAKMLVDNLPAQERYSTSMTLHSAAKSMLKGDNMVAFERGLLEEGAGVEQYSTRPDRQVFVNKWNTDNQKAAVQADKVNKTIQSLKSQLATTTSPKKREELSKKISDAEANLKDLVKLSGGLRSFGKETGEFIAGGQAVPEGLEDLRDLTDKFNNNPYETFLEVAKKAYADDPNKLQQIQNWAQSLRGVEGEIEILSESFGSLLQDYRTRITPDYTTTNTFKSLGEKQQKAVTDALKSFTAKKRQELMEGVFSTGTFKLNPSDTLTTIKSKLKSAPKD